MADYRKNEIISGGFVLLAVLVYALFAFKVGGLDLGFLGGETVSFRAHFTDVKSLENGVDVEVGGRPVGKVTVIRIVERPLDARQVEHLSLSHAYKADGDLVVGMLRQLIEVEFELSAKDLKIVPQHARVRLRQTSPLAPHFVELDPGEWSSPEQSINIFAAAEKSMDGKPLVIESVEESGLTELIASAKRVLDELRGVLRDVNDEILSPANTEAFGVLLEDFHKVVDQTGAMVGRVDAFIGQDLGPRAREILDALAVVSKELDGRLGSIESQVNTLLTDVDAVVRDNRAEVAEAIRRLRRTLWAGEMALRRIRSDPSVLFFGSTESDFDAREQDETWIRRTGRAGAYEQRDEEHEGDQ
jgi:ABC-type transporter Mla subunit MlaD